MKRRIQVFIKETMLGDKFMETHLFRKALNNFLVFRVGKPMISSKDSNILLFVDDICELSSIIRKHIGLECYNNFSLSKSKTIIFIIFRASEIELIFIYFIIILLVHSVWRNRASSSQKNSFLIN